MSDIFQNSLNLQQEYAKKWLESLNNLYTKPFDFKNPMETNAFNDYFTNLAKQYQGMWNEWQNNFSANQFGGVQPWSWNLFNTNNIQMDAFNKAMNASQVYGDLFALWQRLVGKDAFQSKKEIEEFIEAKSDTYKKITEDILLPFLPENGRALFGQAQTIWNEYVKIAKDFSTPWADASQDSIKDIKSILTGNKEGYASLFENIEKTYKQTFGKLFSANSMGLSKEYNEQVLEGLDTYNQMMVSLMQLIAVVERVSKESTVRVVEAYQDLVKKGGQPQSMKDFYNLFVKITEESFINVFGTEEFSILFCEFAKRVSEFKSQSDLMIEKSISWLPVPKNSEMKNLYKTVYELRKESYYNTKVIKELKEEIEALKASKAVKE